MEAMQMKRYYYYSCGESVEADIVSWYKENGDYVDMDEPIVELETDSIYGFTCEISGILSIDIDTGTVTVGQVIGSLKLPKLQPS